MYDIFISYRRLDSQGLVSGTHIARLLKYAFLNKGYKVFFDYSDIRVAEDFEKKICSAIKYSKVFFLVITRDTFWRCSEESDWVRKEIEVAINNSIPIIPLDIDASFKGWPLDLPETLTPIRNLNQCTVHTDSFFEKSIDVLSEHITEILNPNSDKERRPDKSEEIELKTLTEDQQKLDASINSKPNAIEEPIESVTNKVDQDADVVSTDKGVAVVDDTHGATSYQIIKDEGDNRGNIEPVIGNDIDKTKASSVPRDDTDYQTDSSGFDLIDLAEEFIIAMTNGINVDENKVEEEAKKEKDNYDDLEKLLTGWVNGSEDSVSIDGVKEEICTQESDVSREVDILANPITLIDQPTAIYKVKVDKKSILYIDGEEVRVIEPNVFTSITLPQNEYIRTIVEYGNEINRKEDVLCLTRDKAELINL